jgi:hypothetical protein
VFAPETLRFARPLTLPCRVHVLELFCVLLTCAFALLFAPAFCYAETGTAFLLGIAMYAIAIYMFACIVAAAAFIPSRRIGVRWLLAIALVAALLNPDLRPALGLGEGASDFVVITYLIGIVPYGFPFGVVGVWALVASLRAARSRDRKAIAYGMVPVAIAAAYFAGYPLADLLVPVTIPRMIRPAIPLPNMQPQIVAYELDGGSAIYASYRFAVRDDSRIGIARATELVRRTEGFECTAGSRTIVDGWYDVSLDCNGSNP